MSTAMTETVEWDGTWPVAENVRRERFTAGKFTDDGRMYTVIDSNGLEHHFSNVSIEQTDHGPPVYLPADADGVRILS